MRGKVVERGSWSIAGIPSSWEWCEFNLLFNNVSDSFRKLKQSDYQETGIFPVIDQGSQFIAGYTDDSDLVLPSKPPFVLFGDHTKCIKFIDFSFVQGADGVKVFSAQGVLPKYAYWAMRTISLPDKGYSRHFKFLKESFFPIAPLPEQSRVVAKIEELFSGLDAGISALKRVQVNLKRYRASVLKAAVEGKLTEQWRGEHPDVEPAGELLNRILADRRNKWEEDQLAKYEAKGKKPPENWKEKYEDSIAMEMENWPRQPRGWEIVPLVNICKIEMGQSPPSLSYNKYGDGLSFFQGKAEFTELFPIPIKWCTDPKKVAFQDDILVSVRAPVGPTNLAPSKCCIGRGLSALSPYNGVENRYILYAMRLFESKLARKGTGTTFKAISRKTLSDFCIPLPSTDEQRQIITEIEERLTKCDKATQILGLSLQRSERLRQSILKRAFDGKLVPQDPNDEPASVLLERIKSEREKMGKANQQSKTKCRRKRGNHGN